MKLRLRGRKKNIENLSAGKYFLKNRGDNLSIEKRSSSSSNKCISVGSYLFSGTKRAG